MKPYVRPARREDIDSIVLLLNDSFSSPRQEWRRLFEYPGVEHQPNLGFILEFQNQVVGFLGAIYSERLVEGRVERFCNLSSWCIMPEFRASSVMLLTAALTQRGYTFTTLTPSQVATQVVKAFGFQALESSKLLCGPWCYRALVKKKQGMEQSGRFRKLRRAGEIVIETALIKRIALTRRLLPSDSRGGDLFIGANAVRPMLSKADQQLLDDHRQCGHFLVPGRDTYSYVVTVNRKLDFGRRSLVDFVVSDILHISSPGPALHHWNSLCDSITTHQGSHAITADERFFDLHCPEGLRIPCYSYFMSRNGVKPNQIDSLHTEMVLLDLLVYL